MIKRIFWKIKLPLRSTAVNYISLIVIWLRECVESRAEVSNLEEKFLTLLGQQGVEECIRNNKEVVCAACLDVMLTRGACSTWPKP